MKGVIFMTKTMSKTAKIARVRKFAERARSKKGARFTEGIIEKLCEIQGERPDLFLEVGSSDGLVRNLSFFKKYSSTLRFYDQSGNKFHFSGKAKPVQNNEIFIATSISEKYKRIRVYARFPGEN